MEIELDSVKVNTAIGFRSLETTFESALEVGLLKKDVRILKRVYDTFDSTTNHDKKSPMDEAFREYMLYKLMENVEGIGALVRLSVDAVRQEIASVTIPVVLLADVFDVVTLDKCELIFNFVEEMLDIWKEEIFFTSCKNNILRMCNDLLRRLSRSQNTVFCGRILLFLSKFFPLSERSGLNIVSEFNLENVTEYGTDDKSLDDGLENTVDDIPIKVDYNLYCKFWSLQDFFRNPVQCYSKTQWKMFQSHTNTVLDAFDGFKLDCGQKRRKIDTEKKEDNNAQSAAKSTMKNSKQDVDNENIFKSEIFFAKYLTNPKLLALQLSDSKFRRATLVQFLILFQYLQSKVKFKTESNVLTSSQELYIETTQTRVYTLIEETPPNGKQFLRTVQHILNREEIWNKWKNDGCKEIRKPDDVQNNVKAKEETQVDTAATSEVTVSDVNLTEELLDESNKKTQLQTRKRLLGDTLRESYNSNRYYLGHPLLTELWNLAPDNLSACKSEDRNFLPEFEVYLNNKNDRSDSSSWRALRLLARQSPHFFTTFNSSSTYKIPDYLENMRRRIIREKLESAKPTTSSTVSNGQGSSNGSTLENEDMTLTEAEQEAEPELGADEDIEKSEDDKNAHSKPLVATQEQIEEIAPLIGDDWKKLGKKLGYTPDELEFFETEHTEGNNACVTMLVNWCADDDDATLDNWAYMMEGLEINEAATAVKAMIERLSAKANKTDVEVISD